MGDGGEAARRIAQPAVVGPGALLPPLPVFLHQRHERRVGSHGGVFLNVSLERPGAGARAGLVLGSGLVAFGLLVSPFKLCLVAALLHVPCPGCGLTRAAFAMARGDLAHAVALQPLSVVIVPMLAWIAATHALRYVRTGS